MQVNSLLRALTAGVQHAAVITVMQLTLHFTFTHSVLIAHCPLTDFVTDFMTVVATRTHTEKRKQMFRFVHKIFIPSMTMTTARLGDGKNAFNTLLLIAQSRLDDSLTHTKVLLMFPGPCFVGGTVAYCTELYH